MEATVGGVPFEALAPQATFAQGNFGMVGTRTSGGVTTSISVSVIGAEQGASYDLDPTFSGTFGQVGLTSSGSNAVWTTILSPGEGSISFTTLNADRAAGTFHFIGQASTADATGQKTVTSGTFDIEL